MSKWRSIGDFCDAMVAKEECNPLPFKYYSELGLENKDEFSLAMHLINFGHTLEMVIEDHRPNFLCNYLFELAGQFGRFYEACPVLKAEEGQRESRLVLCELTARVLREGLDALGIEVTEVM